MMTIEISGYCIRIYPGIRHCDEVYWCLVSPLEGVLDDGWQPNASLARAAAVRALFNHTGIRV